MAPATMPVPPSTFHHYGCCKFFYATRMFRAFMKSFDICKLSADLWAANPREILKKKM
jgi:hypothetical protein